MILLLTLLACSTTPAEERDDDLDGFLGADDCDDTDADINPDAEEVCDEVDHDCDGATGLEDPDEDGSPDCEDCADNDARRSPLNPELCDEGGLDEDCDGLSNMDDPDVDYGDPVYPDEDGDGLGDASAEPLLSCEPPADYVTDNTDCDDDSADVPGTLERCGDGRDNDCDGVVDVCADIDIEASAGLIGDTTRWAVSIDLTHDLTGDGLADLLVGAPDGGPGAAYVFAGPLDDTVISDNVAVFLGSGAFDTLGRHVAAGDVTGDGDADAVLFRDAGFGTVEVRIFSGPVAGSYDVSSEGIRVGPPQTSALIGGSVALSDLDGDGVEDLLAGAPIMDVQAGRAYLLLGPITGDTAFTLAQTEITALAPGDRLGEHVTPVGDIDGDGDNDAAICSPQGSGGAGYCGILTSRDVPGDPVIDELTRFYEGATGEHLGKSAHGGGDLDGDGESDVALVADDRIILLRPKTQSGINEAEAIIDGFGGFDDVSLPGDIDGDGVADVWLAGRGADGTQTAWLLHGPWSGTLDLGDLNDSSGPYGTRFTSTLDHAGPGPMSVSAGGDHDGDGRGDLALGLGDDTLGEVHWWSGWAGAL